MSHMNSVIHHFRHTPLALTLAMVSFHSFAESPTIPNDLAFEFVDDRIELSWSASTDDDAVAGYNLYRNDRYFTTVLTTEISLSIPDSLGQEFYVVSFDAPSDGESRSYSGRSTVVIVPAEAVVTENTAPLPPSALSAQRSSSTTIEISWSGASDDASVEGYNVFRDDQYLATEYSTTFTDRNATAGATHNYYVVAFDEAQLNSSKSPLVAVNGTVGSTSIVGVTATEPEQGQGQQEEQEQEPEPDPDA